MTKTTIRSILEYDSVLKWHNQVYAENAAEAIEYLLAIELPKYSFGHADIVAGNKETSCFNPNYLRETFVKLSEQYSTIKISFYSKNNWGYAKGTYLINKLEFI